MKQSKVRALTLPTGNIIKSMACSLRAIAKWLMERGLFQEVKYTILAEHQSQVSNETIKRQINSSIKL